VAAINGRRVNEQVVERRPVIAATKHRGLFAACAASNPDFDQKLANFWRFNLKKIPIRIVFDRF
jgi:hypothetical protein